MTAPRRLVRFLGLARSGNHAIINWVLKQLGGEWCFLNCVQAKAHPFYTARPMNENGVTRLANYHGVDRRLPADHLLLSMEDTFLKPAFGETSTAAAEQAAGRPEERLDIIVIRDPYNLFASRRGLSGWVLEDQTALRVWKQHARACLGEARGGAVTVTAADYNAWMSDRAYRHRLAGQLDLDFTDAGLDEVPDCGGGSSFDGQRMNGRAHDMAVGERWRRYAGDAGFARLFDPETHALAARLFQDAAATEARQALAPSALPARAAEKRQAA